MVKNYSGLKGSNTGDCYSAVNLYTTAAERTTGIDTMAGPCYKAKASSGSFKIAYTRSSTRCYLCLHASH